MRSIPFALTVAVWAATGIRAWSQPSLQQLYENQRWFELRDALRGQEAPALYRAAVASAFNRTEEAEAELSRIMRESSDAKTVSAAADALFGLYMRTGRFGDALTLADEVLKASPQRADVMNFRALLAAAGATNQQVTSSRRASFACVAGAVGGIRMPLSVNGREVNWALDTGFNLPGLSEAEARMLGIAVPETKGEAADGQGGSTSFRMAVADRVTVGGTELRHVLMGVFPDSQQPWNEWQAGQRGLIGLPIALALQTIRWTSDGTCETGPRTGPAAGSQGNMAFHGMAPIVEVIVDGKSLSFDLDTGNMTQSQLWSRFAADFADLVTRQGTKGRVTMNQIGGSKEHEVIVLPEVRMRVGGFDTVLRPANIFSLGDARSHGNLGMDLLSQASEVTIDFESMTLSLR
jgi:hypothetical protein